MNKPIVFLLCFCCLVQTLFAVQCTRKACSISSERPQEGEQCYVKQDSQLTGVYTTCADSTLVCDVYFTQDCISYREAHFLGYPGEICWEDAQCWSSNCKGGFCVGAKLGNKCQTDYSCDIGMYCEDGNCAAVKGLNEGCDSSAACRLDLVCNNGVCSDMYSFPAGMKIKESPVYISNHANSYQSIACTSGWAYPNADGTRTCSSAPPTITNQVTPYKCKDSNDVCVYKFVDSDFSFNTSCVCGNDALGSAYCPIVPVNERNLTTIVKNLTKSAVHCSTASKGQWMECGDVTSDIHHWKDLIVNYNEAYFWSGVANNPDCFKHTVEFAVYWWAKEGVNPIIVDSASILSVGAAIITSLLLALTL